MKGKDLACLGVQGQPCPLFVRLLLHKAGYFVRFYLKALYQHSLLTGEGLDMQMIGQCLQALDEKAQ